MLIKIVIVFLGFMLLVAMFAGQIMKWMGKKPRLATTCKRCGRPLIAGKCDCKG
ncbi:hypothetical protein [Ketogulonicigenium vulgare]|uniref:Uncharacterized protein n=1 Tax=Ketogulonicigenium vulgare (strain WSH-001) TaxID=759362 RepID=F9Y8E3_KETVW|nr:hypothetical protein [Ketogulonicigenium vulgare]ADO41717.1 hypothetical protein EIO_0555 [Ketogulonicigenium vulgare Y25]AEM39952.1 hypothetical protein KVU_0113 [Ketogulonicigenium vulgare WSH-001]ALJ80162.1 hypothetical protein KVH_02610 [Ketogulonicigenium vulgare]ANW34885.1 hypothetical protein KvSKV_02605 [Ketogulonicigenium vulgare]AOZ53648.1 hypothetical protein KVC_0624 [Ketogulonicigenium vulgare]